jgi:protocatechuate 3,4-dioxygenase beta subunit
MLGLLGGLGAAVVVAGCGDDATTSAAPTTTAGTTSATSTTTAGATSTTAAGATSTTAATAVTSCTVIPEETAGPYPGDGTNGPNVLTQSGVVRSDIRTSLGTGKVATGVPLTVKLNVVDTKNGCKALAGAAVYLWHCDQSGLYSMYSQGVTGENYLRGVQATDANGSVTFTSIFPAAYSGRWPHIHFEVFPSLASATNGANKLRVSQLALPDDVCKAVFATSGYSQSVTNHAQTSLARDNVFSDGVTLQTPTVTGNTTAGYVATLLVAV